MSDVRLVGTNPEDGSLVPVSVTSGGLLRTNIGKIELIPNDVEVQGKITATSGQINGDLSVTGQVLGSDGQPIGEDGVELPPNPGEGQVLGWQNGELVWMDQASGGFFFELDYLIVGGGGNSANGFGGSVGGGGGGGFINSIVGEFNPGNVATPGPMRIPLDANGVLCTALVSGAGSDTMFAGPGWNLTAYGGGTAGTGESGGSGGGGLVAENFNSNGGIGGAGVKGQGFGGSAGGKGPYAECWDPQYFCNGQCTSSMHCGAGGGAGGLPNAWTPGPGLPCSITGETLIYCAGGPASSPCAGQQGPVPDGAGNYGSAGGKGTTAQPGVLILRYPNFIELSKRSGEATLDTVMGSQTTLTWITNGYASLQFKIKPGTVTTLLIDYLRRLRD